jgi:hypothetical protein
MAKVKCIKMFFDLTNGFNRQVGEEFEVSTEIANNLNRLGFVEVEYKVEDSVKPTEDKSIKPSFKKK